MEKIRSLLSTTILGSMVGMGGVVALSQLLVAASSIVLTRLYSVDDFGQFGLFLSLVAIMSVVPALGFPEAIVAPRNRKDAVVLLAVALLCSIFVAIPIALLGVTFVLNDWFGYGGISGFFLLLLYPAIGGSACMLSMQFWLLRNHDWTTIRRMAIAQAALRIGIQIPLGFLNIGAIGLALGETIMRVSVAAYAAFRSQKDIIALSAAKTGVTRARMYDTIFRYRHFPIFRVPSNLINTIGMAVIVPLVVMKFGITAGGYYTLMEASISAPLSLVNKAIGDIYLGYMSARIENRSSAWRLFILTGAGLALIAAVPVLLLYNFGPDLFAFVFGSPWRISGNLASIMAPVLFMGLVFNTMSGTINAANRPELKLIFDAALVATILITFFVPHERSHDLQATITLYSTLMCVAYLLLGALSAWALSHPRKDHGSRIDP